MVNTFKSTKYIVTAMAVLALSACGDPLIDQTVEIAPNETAFVIPLEGASKADQGKFNSIGFLEQQKVATKRIYLPQKKKDTGRMWFDYVWIPTSKVITVNRAPITFVWETSGKRTGGIKVESKDSIGFSVGINTTAHVKEADTATFLYNYPSGNLKNVLNNIVKSKSTEVLSREFARYDLEGEVVVNKKTKVKTVISEGARQQKGVIVALAKKELVEFFKQTGVTITTFGLIGGLQYEDASIQTAINNNFSSELEIKNKKNERLGQEEINAKKVSIATAERVAATEFRKAAKARSQQVALEVSVILADAELEKAKRWDGKLPSNIMPQGSNFILDMNK